MKLMAKKVVITPIEPEVISRAILNLEKAKGQIVKKLSSSTTAAQGHISLLTSVVNDIENLENLLPKPIKVPATKKTVKIEDKE